MNKFTGMVDQEVEGVHIGVSNVLAIISFSNGGDSMREGLMFIENMKKIEPLKEDFNSICDTFSLECGCRI